LETFRNTNNHVVEVPANTQVIVKGINKEVVGELAANIRGVRPPEPYKGKGIRITEKRSWQTRQKHFIGKIP
jgi:ribosomal protein L6P/L9E